MCHSNNRLCVHVCACISICCGGCGGRSSATYPPAPDTPATVWGGRTCVRSGRLLDLCVHVSILCWLAYYIITDMDKHRYYFNYHRIGFDCMNIVTNCEFALNKQELEHNYVTQDVMHVMQVTSNLEMQGICNTNTNQCGSVMLEVMTVMWLH